MNLVIHPNPVLRKKCSPVPVRSLDDPDSSVFCEDVVFEESLEELVTAMQRIMKDTEAVGLAANQAGVTKRVFLMQRFYTVQNGKNIELHPREEIHVIVNPVILERSKELMVFVEGCLSFPDKKVQTRRPGAIKVAYYSERGTMVCEILDGLESIIFQHELDHLNGKDMYDREFNGRVSRLYR